MQNTSLRQDMHPKKDQIIPGE